MIASPQEAATPAPRERGILFSAPMVLAILAGKKTQTRRAWKEQPLDAIAAQRSSRVIDGRRGWAAKFSDDPPGGKLVRCRFGEVGDRLWVRETFYTDEDVDDCAPGNLGIDDTIIYAADGIHRGAPARPGKKRPGIHMPRWASRITLDITDVRVQRLQDISEADARAEGVTPDADCIGNRCVRPHRDRFMDLWDEINGKRANWKSNPWVWALTFRRLP